MLSWQFLKLMLCLLRHCMSNLLLTVYTLSMPDQDCGNMPLKQEQLLCDKGSLAVQEYMSLVFQGGLAWKIRLWVTHGY